MVVISVNDSSEWSLGLPTHLLGNTRKLAVDVKNSDRKEK